MAEESDHARPDPIGALRHRLRLPLIAAPMFLVSNVALVVAACQGGVIGAFPTANCRTAEELDDWIERIRGQLSEHEADTGQSAAPYCPNLIVHKSNPRLAADLGILVKQRPQLVITSVGSPALVIDQLHAVGTAVYADVATIKQAHKALAAGADGLILLTAGAGGQTGWINPFVFVRAVRSFFAGPLVMAGGIMDGYCLAAAQMLGCDLGYMGTKFIATTESAAPAAHKEMLIAASADDILLTAAFSGLPANLLRPSLIDAGLDPDHLPAHGPLDIAKDISIEAFEARPKLWKQVWSAGHSTSGVNKIMSVAALIEQTQREYAAALRSRLK